MARPIQAVLTDVGNVVLRVMEERAVAAIASAAGLPPEQVTAMMHLADAKLVNQVNAGRLSMRDLFERHLTALRDRIDYPTFASAWRLAVGEDFPQVRDAYFALPADVSLNALSNVNDVHCDVLHRHWLIERCKGFYASNEIGLVKPAPEVYRYVLADMDMPPEAVLFFDDAEENVAAAARLGIRAVHVPHPDVVPQTLREIGLVS